MRKGQKIFYVYCFDKGIEEVRYQGKSTVQGKLLIKSSGSEYTDRVDIDSVFVTLEEAVERFEQLRLKRIEGAKGQIEWEKERLKYIKVRPCPIKKWSNG